MLTMEKPHVDRGEFKYWSLEQEQRWKALAPTRPEIADVLRGITLRYPSFLRVTPNEYAERDDDKYGSFDVALATGRNYLVGDDMPMEEFIRKHRSPMKLWMPAAFKWARDNPYYSLAFDTPGKEWVVRWRGEYVEIGLPHHDSGGEKYWISRDGKTRVLINVD